MFFFNLAQLTAYNGHIGGPGRRVNLQMGDFVIGRTKTVSIFDLRISVLFLRRSLLFLRNCSEAGGYPLFISSNIYLDQLLAKMSRTDNALSQFARTNRSFYFTCTGRWVGGFLTNFRSMSDLLRYAHHVLNSPSNHFHPRIRRHYRSALRGRFRGVSDIVQFPACVIHLNLSVNAWLSSECSTVLLPLIALVDSNISPVGVTYPVPCNLSAFLLIRIILRIFVSSLFLGALERVVNFEIKVANKVASKASKR